MRFTQKLFWILFLVFAVSSSSFLPSTAQGQEIQKIGAILPLSGNLSEMGAAFSAATQMAVDEINQAYTDNGVNHEIELLIHDSASEFITAQIKLETLKDEGVQFVIGPAGSEACFYCSDYANDNNMLLLSGSSTAVGASIAGDNLMRFVYNDEFQGQALADRMYDDGIRHIVILAQTDIYGQGLIDAITSSFEAKGGALLMADSIRGGNIYDVEHLLAEDAIILAEKTQSIPAEQVGIILITYQQGIEILQAASQIDTFMQYRWYGTDSLAKSSLLLENQSATEAAQQTQFTCSVVPRLDNTEYNRIQTELENQLGYAPTDYTPVFYDIAKILAQTLEIAPLDDIEAVKQSIRDIAANYQGATGPILFDDADDRNNNVQYQFWTVTQEAEQTIWSQTGNWTPSSTAIPNWKLMH